MFSQAIVESDAFLDMPLSTQGLYFHLSMNADDYGFVGPKRVMRMVGANDDDLKVLIGKRYVLIFDSGVVVIKHWMLNNTVRKDRSQPTTYSKEFESLIFNEFGAYTERRKILETIEGVENATTITPEENRVATKSQPNDNQMTTQIRLDYIRLDKTRLDKTSKDNGAAKATQRIDSKKIDAMFSFWHEQTAMEITGNVEANRKACSNLLKTHGDENLKKLISGVGVAMNDQYAPRISDFVSLKRKQNDLIVWGRKHKAVKNGVFSV